MFIWDSENGKSPYPVAEDAFHIALDEQNSALRISDYEANGSHTTTVGFLGPQAEQNAQKWDEFTDTTSIDLNCETKYAIKQCFGLD